MSAETLRGRMTAIGAVTLLVVLFFLNAAAHFDYTPDDSYIYFRYAVNLASGEGFSFNPGETSFGFTSPLWLGILSGAVLAGADVATAGKALDLLFASLSIVVFFFVAYEMLRDLAAAFLGSLAWSANAWLVRWAGTGLETSLAVLLVLATFLFLLRNRYRESFLLLGLLILTRPETVLLLAPFAADYIYNTTGSGLRERFSRGGRLLATLAGLTALVLIPWGVIAWINLGTVVPSTLQAKQGASVLFDPAELVSAGRDLSVTLGSADGAVILLLIGAVLARQVAGIRADVYMIRQGLASWIWIVLLPAAYVMMNVNIVSRYLLVVTPMICLLAYFEIQSVLSGLSRHAAPSNPSVPPGRSSPLRRFSGLGAPVPRALVTFAATAVILLQNQYIYTTRVRPHLSAFAAGMEESLIPIARYLEANSPPGTVVLAGDVGALGYFSNRNVCDFNRIVRIVRIVGTAGNASPMNSSRPEDDFTQAIRSRTYEEICDAGYILHGADVPEALADVLHLVPVMSRPFGELSISDPEPVHFTLYKVIRTADVALR